MDTKPKFTKEITKGGISVAANYKVRGYWCHDSVRVFMWKNVGTHSWEEPAINWVSGGRSVSEEPDDTIAAECFAAALKDAVKLARKWKKNPPKL